MKPSGALQGRPAVEYWLQLLTGCHQLSTESAKDPNHSEASPFGFLNLLLTIDEIHGGKGLIFALRHKFHDDSTSVEVSLA